ncbi:glycosyltransferase family 4 protein [Flavihumibacter fluvii]|uniref:glycosyltransferase family 4 protein n=1 Tax=Flavihumibacter fluvii TaxID=2838157 RepID=UPI001BDDD8DD|nr:glycosyltransferase family 4 protein [Flavihumibacter fluvii]ULQ52404.1 glycosyltransferase family 4 protein [Flavihumibacter fluvii]
MVKSYTDQFINGPKKILIFTDWYDPAYKAGGPVQSCVNFCKQMNRDYELFVFTSNRDLNDTEPLQGIAPNNWILHTSGARVFYAEPGSINLFSMRKLVKSIAPDFIYLNSMFSLKFTIFPLLLYRLGKFNATIILSPRGMLKDSAMSFRAGKKKIFLAALKFAGIPGRIHFHATDQTEKKDIEQFFPGARVSIAPNFPAPAEHRPGPVSKEPGKLNIVFIGRIHPIKQLHILLAALENIKGLVQLHIVGSHEDEKYWQLCKQLIDRFQRNITIIEHGSMPHQSVMEILMQQHLFVLPTLGENFGHAISEALNSGIPVLISDQTPWRFLEPAKAGWDISLNEPEVFARKIEEAVGWNQQEFDLWRAGALSVANKYAEKNSLVSEYRKIFS